MPSCIISSNCIHRRFVVPTCIKIPKSRKNNLQATSLFLLSVGFYVAVARILFLLLVHVWQQQDFFSYCWFLCGSNKTSFITVGSCVAATRFLFFSYCRFLCGSNNTSYCWFLCDNNKVSFDYFHSWSVGLVRCWVGLSSGCA